MLGVGVWCAISAARIVERIFLSETIKLLQYIILIVFFKSSQLLEKTTQELTQQTVVCVGESCNQRLCQI